MLKGNRSNAAGTVQRNRIAIRGHAVSPNRNGELVQEASGGQETAFLVPRLGLLDFVPRARMEANGHSGGRADAGGLPPMGSSSRYPRLIRQPGARSRQPTPLQRQDLARLRVTR